MPEPVKIPIAFFEVTLEYERPRFELWLDRAPIVQGIFDALSRWAPRIDDAEAHTTGKISDQGFTLKLPLKRVAFFFGPAYCKFVREDIDRRLDVETLDILDVAVSALKSLTKLTMSSQKTSLVMHLQLQSHAAMTILGPMVAKQLISLTKEPLRTVATIAVWDGRKVTIDGSSYVANGVFLRLDRDFVGTTSWKQMAEQIRQDEDELFQTLNVQEG